MNEKAKTAPVTLIRDYWPANDERIPAGTRIDLPVAEARRLIDANVAERADALPGE